MPVLDNNLNPTSATEPNVSNIIGVSTLFVADYIAYGESSWNMVIAYEWDSGIEMMPLAEAPSPGNPYNDIAAKMVNLSAPFGRKIITCQASRVGAPPLLPSPLSSDSNLVLKTVRIAPQAPALEPDGLTHNYTVLCVYTYHMLRPPWFADGLTMGATAYDITPAALNVMNPAMFVAGYF